VGCACLVVVVCKPRAFLLWRPTKHKSNMQCPLGAQVGILDGPSGRIVEFVAPGDDETLLTLGDILAADYQQAAAIWEAHSPDGCVRQPYRKARSGRAVYWKLPRAGSVYQFHSLPWLRHICAVLNLCTC
jgi:hypothetical protein